MQETQIGADLSLRRWRNLQAPWTALMVTRMAPAPMKQLATHLHTWDTLFRDATISGSFSYDRMNGPPSLGACAMGKQQITSLTALTAQKSYARLQLLLQMHILLF